MAAPGSAARISPRRRWFSGVFISSTTMSPSSPRVQVTRTTRWPAATDLAIRPPVPMGSSSGWAWAVLRGGGPPAGRPPWELASGPTAASDDPAATPAGVVLTQAWATEALTDVRTGESFRIADLVADDRVG